MFTDGRIFIDLTTIRFYTLDVSSPTIFSRMPMGPWSHYRARAGCKGEREQGRVGEPWPRLAQGVHRRSFPNFSLPLPLRWWPER